MIDTGGVKAKSGRNMRVERGRISRRAVRKGSADIRASTRGSKAREHKRMK